MTATGTRAMPGEVRELAVGETRRAHRAMQYLRPDCGDVQAFTTHVDTVLRPGGYRLVASLVGGRDQAAAVAGFRVSDNLAWGHHLYVDDLSTSPDARREGHAGALMLWLAAEARRLGCAQLHLDSATGAHRFDAHRLYYNHGLAIYSHHFAREL